MTTTSKKMPKQWTKTQAVTDATTRSLRFSPTAWAKLLFLRDYGETEVGGFGIAPSDDLLFVEDIQLVRQVCSWTHVAFDDESIADFFDREVDANRRPEQFARIWVHTHPGDCPRPSITDEETFQRAFGRADWALMFILARDGQSYTRLRFNVGPRAEIELPVSIDYSRSFRASQPDAWEVEYLTNIHAAQPLRGEAAEWEPVLPSPLEEEPPHSWYESWFDYAADDENAEELLL